MNCQACQYQAQINALRKRCLMCDPESDGGTPHGRVIANEYTLNSVKKADAYVESRIPSGQATNLTPQDEHRLRIAMSSLFGLDPVDLLLVQHLMQGQTLESFGSKLTAVQHVASYKGSVKGMAWARKSKIIDKIPMLSAVLVNLREKNPSRRIESEVKGQCKPSI